MIAATIQVAALLSFRDIPRIVKGWEVRGEG
jgi:hypothetical protein